MHSRHAHATRRLASTVFCLAGLCACAVAAPRQLSPVRTGAWGLHESLRREAFAAIDRGRDFLAAQQHPSGLWAADAVAATCQPGLAFAGDTLAERDAAVLQRAIAAAAGTLEGALSRVLTPAEDNELVWCTALLSLAGTRDPLVARALRRLRVLEPGRFSIPAASLLAQMQDARGATDSRTDWNRVLALTLRTDAPTSATVSLAALARVRRDPDAPSAQALQAHLRWLARHISAAPDGIWPLARLLEEVPPAVLHAAEFPLDWRQRLADALVARQRRDSRTGFGYWSDPACPTAPGSTAALRQTTAAVLALRLLAR